MKRNNTPLYLLAILAAGLAGFTIPTVLLWGAAWLLRQGHWLAAIVALVALVGYVVTLFVAMRGAQTQHYRVGP